MTLVMFFENAKSSIVEATPVHDNLNNEKDAKSTSTKMPDCDQTEGKFEESIQNHDAGDVFENAKSSIVEATPVHDNLNNKKDAKSTSTKMPDCDQTEGKFEESTQNLDASYVFENAKSSIVEATTIDENLNHEKDAESTSTKMPDCDQTEGKFEESTQKPDDCCVFENAKSSTVDNTSVDEHLNCEKDADLTSTKMPDCDQTEGKFEGSTQNPDASDAENAESSTVEAASVHENLNHHKDAELTSTKKQDCDHQTEGKFEGSAPTDDTSYVEKCKKYYC